MSLGSLLQGGLLVAMYFLMAGRDDPFLSFKAVMAAATMTAVVGWVGLALGFAAFLALAGAATGAAGASDML